jgi:hypothetical protein
MAKNYGRGLRIFFVEIGSYRETVFGWEYDFFGISGRDCFTGDRIFSLGYGLIAGQEKGNECENENRVFHGFEINDSIKINKSSYPLWEKRDL